MNCVVDMIQHLFPHVLEGISVTDETDLMNDLGLDSISVIRLLSNIEQQFDIDIFMVSAGDSRYRKIGLLNQLISELAVDS